MNEKGNQYNWEKNVKGLYPIKASTKEQYNQLIAFADNEILEWEKFKSECIQRRNLL